MHDRSSKHTKTESEKNPHKSHIDLLATRGIKDEKVAACDPKFTTPFISDLDPYTDGHAN